MADGDAFTFDCTPDLKANPDDKAPLAPDDPRRAKEVPLTANERVRRQAEVVAAQAAHAADDDNAARREADDARVQAIVAKGNASNAELREALGILARRTGVT